MGCYNLIEDAAREVRRQAAIDPAMATHARAQGKAYDGWIASRPLGG
jgi:hypothetical protein